MVGEASQLDAAKPLLDAPQSKAAGVAMWVAVLLPLIGLAVAIPVGWGWGLSILDLSMAATAYVVTGLAVTVGYHRGFTHRSFKARRGLRIALAVGGGLGARPTCSPTATCGPSGGSPGCWSPRRCSCPRASAAWSREPGPAP